MTSRCILWSLTSSQRRRGGDIRRRRRRDAEKRRRGRVDGRCRSGIVLGRLRRDRASVEWWRWCIL